MAPISEKIISKGGDASSSSGLTKWVEENRNLAIALALGTAVVGGAGIYYAFGNKDKHQRKAGDSTLNGTEKASGSSKKKKNKKKKAGSKEAHENGLGTENGAILEEASDEQLFNLSEDEIQRL